VTVPGAGIDWAEAERRERLRELRAAPVLAAFLAGILLMTGRFAFWTGRTAWAVTAVFLAGFVLLLAATRLVPRLRATTRVGLRLQFALREHVDPGPPLRSRADRQARYIAATGWVGWGVPLAAAGLIAGGQWSHPLPTAVGAVLVASGAAAGFTWWRGRWDDGRRWLADPPGPARDLPPPSTAERWLAGRRGLLGMLTLVLVLAVVPLLVVALR
jgi:hypothetical protein